MKILLRDVEDFLCSAMEFCRCENAAAPHTYEFTFSKLRKGRKTADTVSLDFEVINKLHIKNSKYPFT